MNVVFWLLVILALVALWLCLGVAFQQIGHPIKHLLHVAKCSMNDEIERKTEDSKDE